MNTIRCSLALLIVVSVPPMLLSWFIVHPFIQSWRRLGPRRSYTIILSALTLCALLLLLLRGPLLAIDFGTSYTLVVAGLPCVIGAAILRRKLHLHATNKLFVGLPELDPAQHPTPLITEGLFAHVRHPRYLQVLLAVLGWALLANHLTPYLLVALSMPAILPWHTSRSVSFMPGSALSTKPTAEESQRSCPTFVDRQPPNKGCS